MCFHLVIFMLVHFKLRDENEETLMIGILLSA